MEINVSNPAKVVMDSMKPADEQLRIACLLLGQGLNKEVKTDDDGKEYAYNESGVYYNPFVNFAEAHYLWIMMAVPVLPNLESDNPMEQWTAIAAQKFAIHGPTPEYAISMAAYALGSGQVAPDKDPQIIKPKSGLILPE